MNSRYDFLEQRGRLPFVDLPPWLRRLAVAVGVPGAFLLAGAIVLALAGAIARFDAGIALYPAILGGTAIFATAIVLEVWQYLRLADGSLHDTDVVELPPLSEVPERDGMRAAQGRAIAARLDAQRAARNQSAARGGSVSSTDAGLPPHGSSTPVTEP